MIGFKGSFIEIFLSCGIAGIAQSLLLTHDFTWGVEKGCDIIKVCKKLWTFIVEEI